MKIESNRIISLSPVTSSAASNSSADEMIENENQSVIDRVADLEKKMHDQNDEIMCLRSTLADALRRISSLEGSKLLHYSGRSTPVKDGINLRVRGSPSSEHKRSSAYIPGMGSCSTPTSARTTRRVHHYQSTSSLYSDGHSSSSASPAPSPSPTGVSNNVPTKHTYQPASNLASKTLTSPLNKRWASTSDFSSPNGHSPPPGYPAPPNAALVINKSVFIRD